MMLNWREILIRASLAMIIVAVGYWAITTIPIVYLGWICGILSVPMLALSIWVNYFPRGKGR